MLPANYIESRSQFRRLGMRIGAALHSFALEDADGGAGLSTDIALVGSEDADTMIVIASGTHGVEGYAGAACQFHLMKNIRSYRQYIARQQMAFLLVHAVNPWGYAEDRRVTCEGIDLNRNFTDFPLRQTAPSSYRDYHDRLVTRYAPLPAGLLNEMGLWARAITPVSRRQLQAAITAGQHDVPDGLFYGGIAPCRSRIVWEDILRTYLGNCRTALLVDIHTGLGKSGEAEVISYLPSTHPDFRTMSEWLGQVLRSMADDRSVSIRLDGTLTGAFDRDVRAHTYSIGLEFGTVSPVSALNALRFDQWYHNHASRLPATYRDRARQLMKQAFSSNDPVWLERVLEAFDHTMQQLIVGLSDQDHHSRHHDYGRELERR